MMIASEKSGLSCQRGLRSGLFSISVRSFFRSSFFIGPMFTVIARRVVQSDARETRRNTQMLGDSIYHPQALFSFVIPPSTQETYVGHNRAGDRARAKLKRRRKEETRLAAAASAAEKAKPAAASSKR